MDVFGMQIAKTPTYTDMPTFISVAVCDHNPQTLVHGHHVHSINTYISANKPNVSRLKMSFRSYLEGCGSVDMFRQCFPYLVTVC